MTDDLHFHHWLRDDARKCRANASWRRFRLTMRNRLLVLRRALKSGDKAAILAALDTMLDNAGSVPVHISYAQQRLIDRISIRVAP